MTKKKKSIFTNLILATMLIGLLILGLAIVILTASAKGVDVPDPAASPLHPDFMLLDTDGINVLESGKAISTMQTCGQCHDTEYIVTHSFHADLGLVDYQTTNNLNASNGSFGRWDPLPYRYLSQPGDGLLDLSTPEWLMRYGDQFPGGGPATTSREGKPLLSLRPDANNPEASILNLQTGKPEGWDWSQSGVIENNCFQCHLESPNNAARTAAIHTGAFGWANTATLAGTGIVTVAGESYNFVPGAFNEKGEVRSAVIALQDPTNENCAQCHGPVHTGSDPFIFQINSVENDTTGQVISGQKISESGMNISQKGDLARSWDIHAERQLQCVDCHFSLNNPSHQQDVRGTAPDHLLYDPRRLDIGEYLEKPNHNFARGQSAQSNVAPDLKGTMRRCESCHDPESGHADWLPYIDRHMEVVACETCHIPQLYAPAIQDYDWTVISIESQPRVAYRGIETVRAEVASISEVPVTVTNLVTGYIPVLLQRDNVDGNSLLAPYNLVTSWYWVYDDANGNTRPVRILDLEAAWLEGDSYSAEVLSAFDTNGNGTLDEKEQRIDTTDKQSLLAGRLSALGLNNPRIDGQVQPYSINHNVTRGEWAVNDCQSCHSDESRMTQPIKLSDFIPAGVMPAFVSDTNVPPSGEMYTDDSGALYYQPVPSEEKLYIFGNSRLSWVDWFGGIFFLSVILGISGHGTLRYASSIRKPKRISHTDKVYMYHKYERFWHWLQSILIVLLLLTGLVIHRPDMFGVFSFRGMVSIHNILAGILAVNAALALFYHVTTGEVKQYIPRPYGFFNDAILQTKFYLNGIFKGAEHPFEKTERKKLNPLQQVTYFGILNVLLPMQGLTGILMWGVQRWPGAADSLGGLPFLAPFHTLLAWTFAAFIVGHVYLTTTGREPLEGIKSMVTGWEEVEIHEAIQEIEVETESKE